MARTYWAIMKKFNVLPTDERFQNLSIYQINFIIESMNLDAREEERARRGLDHVAEDDDTSWYNSSSEDFEPVPDFLDADDIATQAYNRLTKSEQEKVKERAETELEDTEESEVYQNKMAMIQKNLEELDKQVGNTNESDIEYSEETIQNALDEFDDLSI
nr:MAG TPA: tail assembly chaperone [Herelleviridae sp.]